MDSARDNIIKVCYYINSNISWHGAGGEGGRIKAFPGELWVGYPSPGMPRVLTGAAQGLAKLGGFPKGQQISSSTGNPRDLHTLTPFSAQTSATPLFPTPPLPLAFPIPIFPSFPLFLPLFPGQAQAAAGILEPGSHRVWAPPNKQRVNKIPPVSHTFSPLPPLIPSFFPLEFNVGFCLSPTPPPPPGCNFFQLCKPRGRARCPTGGVGEWQWEKPL